MTSAAPATPSPRTWGAIKRWITKRYPEVPALTVDELRDELAAPAPPLLLDVRSQAEFDVSHLRGAQRARRIDEALAAVQGLPTETAIVAYCSVGWRSAGLVQALRRQGYSNARNLEGSIFEWANRRLPLARGEATATTVHPYDRVWGRLLAPELRHRSNRES
jgi:rhodanese-related sulfurtransferase